MFRHMDQSVEVLGAGNSTFRRTTATGSLTLSAERTPRRGSTGRGRRRIAVPTTIHRGEGMQMGSTKRVRLASAVLLAGASIAAYAAVAGATASAGSTHAAGQAYSAKAGGPSVKRFDLSGYVIDTDYSLGRNTGNTFRQTYTHSKVQGVPIAGPFVGTKFPAEDYVAMPIGNHELYVA